MASTISESKPAGPALPISIVNCQESDVVTLARIAATSMAVDLLHRDVYPSNNPLDITPQQTNQERELSRSLHNSDARVFKAVTVETGETVGYALFRFEGKREEEQAGEGGATVSVATAAISNATPTVRANEQP